MKKLTTWKRKTVCIENGKWKHGTQDIVVRVMALSDGYAMVRVKGGMPFVTSVKELVFP